jgi:hypothetical protein
MPLLLGDLPGVEQVELDSPRDVGDAGLAGLRAGKSPAFLVFRGLARPGRPRAAKPGHEDLEQERGERVILLIRGKSREGVRRPGRAGS